MHKKACKALLRVEDEVLNFFCRKTKQGENVTGETSRSVTPSRDGKAKKQVSIDTKESKKGKRTKPKEKEEKKLSPRKFIRKSKLKRKRKRHDPLYFGSLIECK